MESCWTSGGGGLKRSSSINLARMVLAHERRAPFTQHTGSWLLATDTIYRPSVLEEYPCRRRCNLSALIACRSMNSWPWSARSGTASSPHGARPPLSEAQLQELRRRVAEDDADPDNLIPWEGVKAKTLSLGLATNGSSRKWYVAVDETLDGNEWTLEIDGPQAYFVFQLRDPKVVAEATRFSNRLPALAGSEAARRENFFSDSSIRLPSLSSGTTRASHGVFSSSGQKRGAVRISLRWRTFKCS